MTLQLYSNTLVASASDSETNLCSRSADALNNFANMENLTKPKLKLPQQFLSICGLKNVYF